MITRADIEGVLATYARDRDLDLAVAAMTVLVDRAHREGAADALRESADALIAGAQAPEWLPEWLTARAGVIAEGGSL